MAQKAANELAAALERRFGEAPAVDPAMPGLAALAAMARHASHRRFAPRPVEAPLIDLLCAVALAAPSKSDLQQRDIIIIEDAGQRRRFGALIAGEAWAKEAPALLVFCGNNRRQRQLHHWHGHAFANDHLDALFNAAVDAAIALVAFIAAAEAAGLGCCPISAVRNRAAEVSALLALPDHVFPLAGLALGWPETVAPIVPRLPLAATVHRDRFEESGIEAQIAAYDARRATILPYEKQRYVAEYGETPAYVWSEDKARQYSKPERADFGAFLRAKGFRLD
jgi:nitroreductase